jgi:hypothetical protein
MYLEGSSLPAQNSMINLCRQSALNWLFNEIYNLFGDMCDASVMAWGAGHSRAFEPDRRFCWVPEIRGYLTTLCHTGQLEAQVDLN